MKRIFQEEKKILEKNQLVLGATLFTVVVPQFLCVVPCHSQGLTVCSVLASSKLAAVLRKEQLVMLQPDCSARAKRRNRSRQKSTIVRVKVALSDTVMGCSFWVLNTVCFLLKEVLSCHLAFVSLCQLC